MANFIRTSYTSLEVIPQEHRYLMHSMYEDNDLDGADEAERTFDFIEREAPGLFVAVLANDSVYPVDCQKDGHFECDHYYPYWYTVLIKALVWKQYQDRVEAKHQEWVTQHGCKLAK